MNATSAKVLLAFLFISFCFCHAGLTDFVHSIHKLRIKSIKQEADESQMLFEGHVEVYVDNKLHLLADKVLFDRKNEILTAWSKANSAIKIEDRGFLFLADKFSLNFSKKIGYAYDVRIHFPEGFVRADKAEKLGSSSWKVSNVLFTPCDNGCVSHWSLRAKEASINRGYFIWMSRVSFYLGSLPVAVLPCITFPIQNRSRSGFLIPKFFFDYENGFGIKQQYYYFIAPRCDTTLGIDWRNKKGTVFSNEFRWVRSPESFTTLNGYYAITKNLFIQRNDILKRAAKNCYWFIGQDFHDVDNVLGGKVKSLARLDFGIDKRIGYHFFYSLDDVNDEFDNTWLLRTLWEKDIGELCIDDRRTKRRFSLPFSYAAEQDPYDGYGCRDAQHKQKKHVEQLVNVALLPHCSWATSRYWKGGHFYYFHEMFLDQMRFREKKDVLLYTNDRLAARRSLIPFTKAHLIRYNYQGSLGAFFSWWGNGLDIQLHPYLQVRSAIAKDIFLRRNVFEKHLFSKGALRGFVGGMVAWSLPEKALYSEKYEWWSLLQPTITWSYVPEFKQDHWYYADRYDRFFARNELKAEVHNTMAKGDVFIDAFLCQRYDFSSKNAIHPLLKGGQDDHLQPLSINLMVDTPRFHVHLDQAYDFVGKRLLDFSLMMGIHTKGIAVDVSYLFQHKKLRKDRELFSNVPHFVKVDCSIPLGKRFHVYYHGDFYAEHGERFLNFSAIKPLLHGVSLEYKGHCWGMSFGYEEKQFRDFGNKVRERSLVFSLRLDSLGSFAKKFRRPQTA